MGDLLAFDDDDSNLFVPESSNTNKPVSRSIDDIFGTNENQASSSSTLDDILTSQPGDDIFAAPQKKQQKKADSKKIDDLFGVEDDEDFDFFSTGTTSSVPVEGSGVDTSLDSLLVNVSQTDTSSKSQDHTYDSLDMLLDIQPEGTVTASENLMSLMDPALTMPGKPDKEENSLFDEQPVPETDESLIILLDRNKTSDHKTSDISGVTCDESNDSLDMLLDTQPSTMEETSTNASEDTIVTKKSEVVSQSDTKVDDGESTEKSKSDIFDDTTDQSKATAVSTGEVVDNPTDVWDGGVPHEESSDSLDMLLDAQPSGMVSFSDTLRSIMDTSISNKDSPGETTDPLDDFFGSSAREKSAGSDTEQSGEVTEEQPREATPEPDLGKPRTNLKKSMERSFEDLLTGLSDESEPELDDMIEDGNDNTNLERYRHSRASKSLLQTPNKSVADSSISDYDASPHKSVKPSRDMDHKKDSLLQDYDFCSLQPHAPVHPPEVKVHAADNTDSLDFKSWEVVENEKESEVTMRHRNGSQRSTSEGEDIDLSAIKDTAHLDVDVNKHKSELGKKGSMALRRKPSRKNRRSLMSTGDDAIFPDTADSSSPGMMNGADEDMNDDADQDAFDMSPPAKKHSPAGMVPLPGFPTRPPPRLSSSDNQDEDMDTPKETKRISKPPPGAFKLPPVMPRQMKPSTDTPSRASTSEDNKTQEFVKPNLRPTKRGESPSRVPASEDNVGFETPKLRKTGNQGGRMKLESSEERDMTFEKPALRSTPKPASDRLAKQDETKESYEPRVLRSTPKSEVNTKTDSDSHIFDKPKLKTTGRPLVTDQQKTEFNTNESAKTFDKPVLRSAQKESRSDSFGDSKDVTHTFEKPSLRNTPNRLVNTETNNKKEQFTTGVFDKPSLRKTTPSPEKEVKTVGEPKGMFDKPALRKTEGSKVPDSKTTTAEKPSWLQTAAEKQTKAHGAIHTKENVSNEKSVPSWLESPRQTPVSKPLQETSNNKQDVIHSDNSSKSSTPRSRESSISGDTEPLKKYSTGSKVGGSNNYSPAWMRQGRSPSSGAVTGMTGLQAAISCPSLVSDEVPQWKRELAQRRMSKKDSPSIELPKKADPVEPEWKKNLQLRKVSARSSPVKESHSVEPEWMKKAEEKKARLRKSTHVDPSEV